MSMIQSARLNGHNPYAYLKDMPERLLTHHASVIDELLPRVKGDVAIIFSQCKVNRQSLRAVLQETPQANWNAMGKSPQIQSCIE